MKSSTFNPGLDLVFQVVQGFLKMEISRLQNGKLQIGGENFIHLLDLTQLRKMQLQAPGPWHETNLRPCDSGAALCYQQSYTESSCRALTARLCIIYYGDANVRCMGKYQDVGHVFDRTKYV